MTRRRMRYTVALLVAATVATDSLAFSNIPKIQTRQIAMTTSPNRRSRAASTSTSSTSLSMLLDGQDASNLLTPLTEAKAFVVPTLSFLMSATPTSASLITDPNVEAEVLNDMSHVALDMVTFFGPATAALRLFTVIGRLLAVSADYVPDHSIHGEELMFQILMLGIAFRGLYQSALPMIASTWSSPSIRDGRTYQNLFYPAGMSWAQYKAMLAVAMDWIEVDPDTVISTEERNNASSNGEEDDQYMYWVYRGDVQVISQGKTLQTISRKTSSPRPDEAHYMALLGDMQFVRSLDERNKKIVKKDRSAKKRTQDKSLPLPKTTIKTGRESGATLLRINTSKLTALMENDEQLGQAIQRLLVTEMQEKLSAMMVEKGPDSNRTAMSLS